MKPILYRLSVGIWLVCAALLLCIPAAARTAQNRPAYWESFGLAACELPCWSGIVPGVTPFERAPYLIEDHVRGLARAAYVEGEQINIWAVQDGTQMAAIVQPSMNRVGVVRLVLTIPLETLIGQFGAPSCVWVDWENANGIPHRLMMVYWVLPNANVGATVTDFEGAALLGGSGITTAYANGLFISLRMSDRFCDGDQIQSWRGFAPAWRYSRWRARN
ncbi:MAG: hypothetical protein SF162_07090 [bacterium]|nr:hypothetical protein [bacterium]